MSLNLENLFAVCNPSRTILVKQAGKLDVGGHGIDSPYYIDFGSFRDEIVKNLRRTITLSPNKPTCQLFTGYSGCGKSTELWRLKLELEHRGFHTILFESSQDLDMTDVDILDLLLVIVARVHESLEAFGIQAQPTYLASLIEELSEVFKFELAPGATFAIRISQVVTLSKHNIQFRHKLRHSLELHLKSLLWSINEEFLNKATEELKKHGKKGLALIVDNLDRLEACSLITERSQSKHLFIDKAEHLKQLNCHKVYTIPLQLAFPSELELLQARFDNSRPLILPMVAMRSRHGEIYPVGINLLKQVILARAFPDVGSEYQAQIITELFKQPDSLDSLCIFSGGHIRQLLRLFYGCLQQEDPPISASTVEFIIQADQNNYISAVTESEWQLLHQITQQQNLMSIPSHQALLQKMFIFAYRYQNERWMALNPLLANNKL